MAVGGVPEAGAQDLHSFASVLELGAFVLADDDQSGGDVCQTDGGSHLVDVLSAVSAGVKDVDFDLGILDLDFGIFDLWQYGHGSGGGVQAALGFGNGDALDTMDAALHAEAAVGLFAVDLECGLFDRSDAGFEVRDLGYLPFFVFGVAVVHSLQVAGEEAGLVPARSGADFDDGDVFVGAFLGEEFNVDVLFPLFEFLIQFADLIVGHADQLYVVFVVGEDVARGVAFGEGLFIFAVEFEDVLFFAVFLAEFFGAAHIRDDLGLAHKLFQLGATLFDQI